MKNTSKIIMGWVWFSATLLPTYVLAFEVNGTKQVVIPVKSAGLHAAANISSHNKTVGLMKITLTPEESAALQKELKKPVRFTLSAAHALPERAALEMQSFAVLDQGQYGSCVMFANSGALNYVLNKSDYVSQLCSLTLGSTLAESSYYPSGWNGSAGPAVLQQLERFGYVTKSDQEMQGCADLKKYPLKVMTDKNGKDTVEKYHLSLKDHYAMSKNFAKVAMWQSILTEDQRFDRDAVRPYNGEETLLQVKKILALEQNKKSRSVVTMGFLLFGEFCSAGACAKTVVENDTWAATQKIKTLVQLGITSTEGHEVMVIGYDDNATAVDGDGRVHRGLLTLRNSWSDDAGDQGNFYMTYDYFKVLVDEVQAIYR